MMTDYRAGLSTGILGGFAGGLFVGAALMLLIILI